jgi:hypothetical protein
VIISIIGGHFFIVAAPYAVCGFTFLIQSGIKVLAGTGGYSLANSAVGRNEMVGINV